MSLVSNFTKNAKLSLLRREVDVTDCKLSHFLVYQLLFSAIRLAFILGYRNTLKDYNLDAEVFLGIWHYVFTVFGSFFFAFLIRFLDHKKKTPYKQLLNMIVMSKVYSPLFLLICAIAKKSTFYIRIAYGILALVYYYRNLQSDNNSKIWFWIVLLLGALVSYGDLFDFTWHLLQTKQGFYIYGNKEEIEMLQRRFK